MTPKAVLMTEEEMGRALKRMAHQILENNQGAGISYSSVSSAAACLLPGPSREI